jgi:hypothetical protein
MAFKVIKETKALREAKAIRDSKARWVRRVLICPAHQ